MNICRRDLMLLGAAAVLPSLPSPARAQSFDQPKILYGFPAGSSGDVAARRVAERMAGSAYAKTSPVIENRPGAGGRIALEVLKTMPADGSVLVMTPYSAIAIYPHVYKKLNYDPFVDFVPVSMLAVMQHGLAVGPLVPDSVKDVKAFLAWAKANPDKASFGSPGAGSSPHFLGSLLGLNAGVDLKHVPYRGSVPGVTDVVGGQIAAMVTPASDFLQNHKAGKLRLIATSGRSRHPQAPEVATFAEQGHPEITMEEWFGFFAPAKTPANVVVAARTSINAALADKAVIDSINTLGLIPKGSDGEEMMRSLKSENERWGPLVKRIGFNPES